MTPGERRRRDYRCDRCDRPLTDVVWTTYTPMLPGISMMDPVTRWVEADPVDASQCRGEPLCDGERVDWQARAKAAEARVEQLTDQLDSLAWAVNTGGDRG